MFGTMLGYPGHPLLSFTTPTGTSGPLQSWPRKSQHTRMFVKQKLLQMTNKDVWNHGNPLLSSMTPNGERGPLQSWPRKSQDTRMFVKQKLLQMTNNIVWNHVGSPGHPLISYHPQQGPLVILSYHVWMIGEDDQGDPTWFQASLLVIWSNFCFTNILVCWLFLGFFFEGIPNSTKGDLVFMGGTKLLW